MHSVPTDSHAVVELDAGVLLPGRSRIRTGSQAAAVPLARIAPGAGGSR